METPKTFFDPYNFNLQNMQMPNVNNMPPDPDINALNPNMYYEQQYVYYRYLTQMIDYKIKLKEWESMNGKNGQTATK